MTKREEIREGILEYIIQHDPRTCLKVFNRVLSGEEVERAYEVEGRVITDWGKVVDQILLKLHSQGVVIKVDRELPPIPRKDIIHIIMERDRVLRKAGYVAVEPLVKGEQC